MISLHIDGREKIGNPILHQQIFMAKDLEKWRRRLQDEQDCDAEVLVKIDKSLDRLLWSIFALNSFTRLSFPKAAVSEPSSRFRPSRKHHATDQAVWFLYPQQKDAQWVFHTECHFDAFLSLAQSASREEASLPALGDSWSVFRIDRFKHRYEELQTWPEKLPSCMRLSTITQPHTIALQ